MIVGRHDPAGTIPPLTLPLDEDARVSRQHARLLRQGGKWFIEDLGSKHGTQVDGREVKAAGPIELPPGTPVVTGDTVWTLIPEEWLLIRRNGLLVSGPCVTAVNYALYHCGVHLVGPLIARNFGRDNSPPTRVNLQVDEYGAPCTIDVPQIRGGDAALLGTPLLPLHVERLRNQTSPGPTFLRVRVEGKDDLQARKPLSVLGFWDWSCDPSARRTLAAFVSPRNPVIEQIVSEAQGCLASANGHKPLDELLRSSRDDAEALCLEGVYRCLLKRRDLNYVGPRMGEAPGGPQGYQTVRPPHHIFARDASGTSGHATCLDLALLMAGCLERIGLQPLVFLIGGDYGVPSHSLAGCWIGPAPGSRPVIEDIVVLRREVAARNILIVESTGVAAGSSEEAGKLAFKDAVDAAARHLADASWGCAVDVGALRPPHGSITPMDCPFYPEVAKAYDEARLLARRKGRECVEMSHLLYGILVAGGEVAVQMASHMGLSAVDTARHLADLVSPRAFGGEPTPTRNFHECQRMASDLAWQSGSPYVREQDLLWAVLTKAPESAAFTQACRRIGLNIEQLSKALEQQYVRPVLTSSIASFASGPPE